MLATSTTHHVDNRRGRNSRNRRVSRHHPLPLPLLMGEEWQGWTQWFKDCDQYHRESRYHSKMMQGFNPDSLQFTDITDNEEEYEGLNLAERLTAKKNDKNASTGATTPMTPFTPLSPHPVISAAALVGGQVNNRNRSSNSVSSECNTVSRCSTPSIRSKTELAAGTPAIRNPELVSKLSIFLPDDAPPLFLDDGQLNTEEYELIRELEPRRLDQSRTNQLLSVGEYLEERISYYRRKHRPPSEDNTESTTDMTQDLGPEIEVKRKVRIMPLSVMKRYQEWQPFGDAMYDQCVPNVNRFADRVYMDYSSKFLKEQHTGGRLSLDLTNASYPNEQIHMESDAMACPNLTAELKVYNQFIKTKHKAQYADEPEAPEPVFIRSDKPSMSEANIDNDESRPNILASRHTGGVFRPKHLRQESQQTSRQLGSNTQSAPEFDPDMHPSERRRLLRQMENKQRQANNSSNYQGRTFGRRTQSPIRGGQQIRGSGRRSRLGSNCSTASSGSMSQTSDKYGLRLYGFNSLEEFDHNDIRDMLIKHGVQRPGRVFIPRDRQTNKNRNFAFVNFRSEEEVTQALDILQASGRIAFDHVFIKVQRSKPRD